jgi:hypothetical protein
MNRALILSVLAALPLAAATPNLTGSWMLNLAKSEYGQFPAPQVMMRQIQHKDPALSMSTYQKGAQGEVTTELKYTTDGKPVVNGENHGTAHWDAGKLVIESMREYQGAQLKQREVWTLSADGKTLTIATHVNLPNGEFDVKQVFEKAPAPAVPTARANF